MIGFSDNLCNRLQISKKRVCDKPLIEFLIVLFEKKFMIDGRPSA